MNKLGVAIDVELDPRLDVTEEIQSSHDMLNPTVPLDRILNAIRNDSVRDPQQYLDETEVLDGGE